MALQKHKSSLFQFARGKETLYPLVYSLNEISFFCICCQNKTFKPPVQTQCLVALSIRIACVPVDTSCVGCLEPCIHLCLLCFSLPFSFLFVYLSCLFRNCCRPTPAFTPDGGTSIAARYTPYSAQHQPYTHKHTHTSFSFSQWQKLKVLPLVVPDQGTDKQLHWTVIPVIRPFQASRLHLKQCHHNNNVALFDSFRLILMLLVQVKTNASLDLDKVGFV